MEKIDIQNFKKYYRKNDGNATLARIGHVNAVIEEVNTEFENINDQIAIVESDITALEDRLDEITANVYDDNAAALLGGLVVGNLYSTTTGEVRIVV